MHRCPGIQENNDLEGLIYAQVTALLLCLCCFFLNNGKKSKPREHYYILKGSLIQMSWNAELFPLHLVNFGPNARLAKCRILWWQSQPHCLIQGWISSSSCAANSLSLDVHHGPVCLSQLWLGAAGLGWEPSGRSGHLPLVGWEPAVRWCRGEAGRGACWSSRDATTRTWASLAGIITQQVWESKKGQSCHFTCFRGMFSHTDFK